MDILLLPGGVCERKLIGSPVDDAGDGVGVLDCGIVFVGPFTAD